MDEELQEALTRVVSAVGKLLADDEETAVQLAFIVRQVARFLSGGVELTGSTWPVEDRGGWRFGEFNFSVKVEDA